MTDWDKYAREQPITAESMLEEPTQWGRVQRVLDRCVGSVLDVGGGDGYIAGLLQARGHEVLMTEASEVRVLRAAKAGVHARQLHRLTVFEDQSFDTVLLGEVLEHLDDPGQLLSDAFRIARQRVVVTVPLLGWADPTHRWRISLDHLVSADPRPDRPDTSEQIVVTWQRGECWPIDWWRTDPGWREQFQEGR